MQPKTVDQLTMVFPAKVVGDYLPPYEEIPEEFKRTKTKWNHVVCEWFFKGLPKGTKFVPKEGIDRERALRHIQTCLGSFEPKHEHKEAGVAYLMSLWFEDIVLPEKPGNREESS